MHIGNAFLAEIDHINRRAYPQLYLGSREIRGKGLGRRAIKLLLKRAFEEMGMHRCYGYPFDYNLASMRMLKSVGYQIEGMMKDHRWIDGAFHNVMILGLLNPNG
jgi:RimJ/RimL family protein N-acetyltransferase